MSELTRLLGTPRLLTWRGTEYQIGLIKLRVRAEYERRLVARAEENLRRRRNEYRSRDEYLTELRVIRQKEDAGEYSILSPVGQGSLRTVWGLKNLFALLIPNISGDDLDALVDDCEDDLLSLLDEIIKDSFPRSTAKAEDQSCPTDTSAGASPS